MRRAALIAGVSIATLLCAGPGEVRAAWNAHTWWGNAPFVSAGPPPARRAFKPRRPAAKAERNTDKTPPIPSGLLHVIVSIDKQRATLFADGAPVASTAISSGTASHPTPMGVFSIIQKSRHHISNLYNAPMPYMQRITWSGSALHQGALPGYPASHGCVRLTETFAQLLWKTTKMGARVIVTRPEVAPIEFDHARLFVPKPQMVEAPPLPVPAPRPAAAVSAPPPAAVAAEPAFTSSVARIRTADATNTIALAVTSIIGDASKAVATSVATEPSANTPAAEQPAKISATDGAGDAAKAEAPVAEATPDAERNSTAAEATPAETQSAEANPGEAQTVEAQAAEAQPVDTQVVETKPVEAQVVEIKPAETIAVEPQPAMTIAAPAPIIVDERPKAMPPAAVREANGRPISVFVSLKESKLYVRQGWKPLFDAPVSFERPDQPIGTHVYTAMGMKVSGEGLRWTVVSIPSGYRRMAELKGANNGRKGRHEPAAKAVEVEGPPPTPGAALDRIVMAPELVERISEMITPGSSLIVSDNKLSDETGEYTDFIVTTR